MSSANRPSFRPSNLDPSLYSLKGDEKTFFKDLTRISDDQELKDHILSVQKEAYEISPYPCIKSFRFLNMKISRFPVYQELLSLAEKRPGAMLLDVGTCFGNDVRKAAVDGFPASQVIGTDIEQKFWDMGHKLFKSDPTGFPITFVQGDIFDDSFLKALSPVPDLPKGQPFTYPHPSTLDLSKSLNPLRGQISAIHASSFFGLFSEAQQLTIAHKLGALLSLEPGSFLFGSHQGADVKGMTAFELHGTRLEAFCHSPESWKDLWEREVFEDGQVECEAKTESFGGGAVLMSWTVRRL